MSPEVEEANCGVGSVAAEFKQESGGEAENKQKKSTLQEDVHVLNVTIIGFAIFSAVAATILAVLKFVLEFAVLPYCETYFNT